MYILKKHNENIDFPSIRIYANKIENRIIFKIKAAFYLELLTPETMKLLKARSLTVPHLEITEVVLIHCNIVNNDYQQDSRVLYTFVPNKPFGSLLEISPTNRILLKTFKSELQAIRVWFTDQNSQPLEVEDKIN